MASDYTRIHRLLKILTLIQSSSGWSAQRLARECGVAVRTIYRDLRTLEAAGIPYFHEADERGERAGYRVRRDFFMPPVQLTLEESLALIALADQVGGQAQVPLTQPAARAIVKVRSQLPASLRDEIAAQEQTVTIRLSPAELGDEIEDVYEKLRQAIARRQVVRCAYESIAGSRDTGHGGEAGGEIRGEFEFHPYQLLFSQRAWYVLGHHGGRGEVRCLRLNRFTQLAVTPRTFTRPRDFTAEQHLGLAWRMIRGKTRYTVELRFDASFAETIADTYWHATQKIIWESDGSMRFACEVDGLDEIVWWVLSMGPHCRVLKPKALSSRVATLARQVAAMYVG